MSRYGPHCQAATGDELDAVDVLCRVAAWARPFLVGDAPAFGSAAWLALPLDDVRRARAVVRAALTWWRMGEPVEDVEERVAAALDRLSAYDVAASMSRDDSGIHRPMHAELTRLRDWSARRDRPDYPGGPVPVWGPSTTRRSA